MNGNKAHLRSTYFDWDLSGYSDTQISDLKRKLETLGCQEISAERGGGAGTSQQILLWLSLHYQDILVGIAANVIYDELKAISSSLFRWYQQNKRAPEHRSRIQRWYAKIRPPHKIRPAIVVGIDFEKAAKSQTITIYIDREYSHDELKQIVNDAEKVTVVRR